MERLTNVLGVRSMTMPKKYTGDLVDGKIVTLSDFAFRCARTMNLIDPAHGGPIGNPVPDEFVANVSYYDNMESEAREMLAWLDAATGEELACFASDLYEGELVAYRAHLSNARAAVQRCQEMLEQVEDWVPPTSDHVDLKQFMIDRLREIIGWNGDVEHLTEPTLLPVTDFAKMKRKRAEGDVAHAQDRRKYEIDRTAKHNEWVRALRDSLPEVPPS